MSPDKLKSCSQYCNDALVVVKERGRAARFSNENRENFTKVKVDGCLVNGELAADWIIRGRVGDLVVELKGIDVEHALQQVLATMSFWRSREDAAARISGLIVCRRYPAVDTKVQRAKNRARSQLGCKLHVTRTELHDFEDLF